MNTEPSAIVLESPHVESQTSRHKPPELRERLLFAANFLRHPHMLGSIVPSSRFLVRRVLEPIDWASARVLVEYGPGVGTLTRQILKRMHRDARLVVIETNEDFVNFLRTSCDDARLHVVQESAANVQSILGTLGLGQADYIISGIPLGSMPDAVREEISTQTREALEPEGKFLVYQFTSRTLPALQRVFGKVQCGSEARNLPPAKIFVCSPKQS